MRLAVFGAGGVGGYFGGRLAEAGHDVSFLARGSHLEAMRRDGLRVDSIEGDFVVRPARAASDPVEVGPVDAVLVAVKAWQVPEAGRAMGPLLGPRTFVVPLQNGVEAPDQLAEAVGPGRVLGGLCRIISLVAGPGHVRHVGAKAQVEIGELDGTPSERVEALRAAFAGARGTAVVVPADIRAALWEKFLFIAPLSALGGVTRLPAGSWREVEESRALMEAAMREILAVARARGVALGEDALGRAAAYVDALPPEATGSMQRDLLEGRPSELEAQTGAVVRLAAESGVEVPANTFLYAALVPAERRARAT